MQGWLLAVDRISAFFGKAFAWLIIGLTLLISFEVFCRYVLNSPNDWVWDTTYILYGILFMMAGAYTLSRNGHVRGDVLYGFFPVRVQAGLDLLLYFLFFFPGVVALVWAGATFAETSWAIREHSSVTASGPPVYHFKTFIPVAGALLLLQGIAEVVRCVVALRDGAWPARLHDVEEVDVENLKKMVGVDVPAAPVQGSAR